MDIVVKLKDLFLGTPAEALPSQSLARKLSDIAGKHNGRVKIQPAPAFALKRAR